MSLETKNLTTAPIDKNSAWKQAFSKAETFLEERPFTGSFLVALLFIAVILTNFKLYFETVDDIYALLSLKGLGISQVPSEFTFQENILLCLFLKKLYALFPAIQWYTGFFVFSLFLSMWGTLAAFNLGCGRLFKNSLFILGSFVIETFFFAELQWTFVAAAAAIGGFLLLAAIWKKEDAKFLRPSLGLALVLILLSVLTRYNILLLIVLASAPAVVYLFWNKKITLARRAVLLFLTATVILSLSAVIFDHAYYFRNPSWGDSRTLLQECREYVFRNAVYNQTTKPFFDSIGWSANDFALFQHNYFMDQESYSVDKLRQINAYFPRFTFNKNPQNTFGVMFAHPITRVALLFFLATLPFLPAEAFWFILLSVVWTLSILIFCRLYLWMPQRIYLPSLFFLNNLTLLFVSSKMKRSSEKPTRYSLAAKWGALFMSLSFIYSLSILRLGYRDNQYWSAPSVQLKEAMQRLNPQDDQLFVVWAATYPFELVGAVDTDDYFQHWNILPIDWFQRNPTTSATMSRFGLKNVFKDIVDNPKVFLICKKEQWDLYKTYMKEKYNIDVKWKIYFSADKLFFVLSVHS
jgi:hypothetical protein